MTHSLHCINPDCPSPYPQPETNKFCQRCGTTLLLENRYIPRQKLGTGGFASIYTVFDTECQIERVLKVLTVTSVKAKILFEQEATVLATLRHPGIPQVAPNSYFAVKVGNPPKRQLFCLLMEKIEGETLEEVLEQYPHGCPQGLVYDWLVQAVDILATLHQRQIIHRDIKPSNLMLRSPSPSSVARGINSQLVLIDFGGAKQIEVDKTQLASTRLFSSGYSPPEQIAGSRIVPASDFYALGRTMIHLLTGKHPIELEDLMTGELQWRNEVQVNPELANLLDEMILLDVAKRPQTAEIIQSRLRKIQEKKRRSKVSLTQTIRQQLILTKSFLIPLSVQVKEKSIQACRLLWRGIVDFFLAFWDTLQEMVSGAIGAMLGTILGFFLTFETVLGVKIEAFFNQFLLEFLPGIEINVGRGVLLFAIAGLGTGLGLNLPRGFNQRRRFIIAGILGFLGYGLGGIFWQTIPFSVVARLVLLITVSVTLTVLGLGLQNYYLFQSLITAIATAIVFAYLVSSNFFPPTVINEVLLLTHPTWLDLGGSTFLFGLLGINIGFWLGVSHYILVPFLRFLNKCRLR